MKRQTKKDKFIINNIESGISIRTFEMSEEKEAYEFFNNLCERDQEYYPTAKHEIIIKNAYWVNGFPKDRI